MKNYENTKISVTNLRKLIRLYIYSKKFEKKVSQPLHKTYEKEFFLINNIWLKDFKKVYNYNSKKQKLDARNNNTNSYESFGTEDSIKNFYQNTDFPFIKLYNNGKDIIYHNIKYINNSKIITEFDNQNKKNNLIYKNFAILDKTTLDILVKGYNVDMFPKINMLLCENSIIFRVTNGIEIGFLNQFDNINHLFLLKFKDNNTLEQEYNKIKLNGIGNYFKENKLKKSEINKQKINNIGEVINLQNKKYNKFLKSFKSFLSKIIESDTSIKIKTSSCIATEFVRKRILSYDKNKSAMFSVINCFISCEEIIHYFLDEKNTQIFNQNKNKFMLSSNISILINELYSQNNSKPYYPDIFLTIINMIFPNDQNNFKEFIKFLLTSLHSEINDIDDNLEIDNQITNEDHLSKEISEKKFFESYKNNIRSIISDNFFWIMQTKKTCNQCKTPSYFYREMYLLELDLKQTNRYMLSQKFEFKKRLGRAF